MNNKDKKINVENQFEFWYEREPDFQKIGVYENLQPGARTDINYFANTDSTNQTDSQLESLEKKLRTSKAILSNMQQDLKWLVNNRKPKSEIDKQTRAIYKLKYEIRDLEEQKKKLETVDEKIDDPWQKLGA